MYTCTFIVNLNMQSSIWVLYLAYCGLNLAQIGLVEGMYHATSILFEIARSFYWQIVDDII
ncbi:MAG: hypothetical protein K2M91_06375, partial [Lachnospiraceae bacterium]|nr:hypothetical protein [Lachnospiraceae bacterium]